MLIAAGVGMLLGILWKRTAKVRHGVAGGRRYGNPVDARGGRRGGPHGAARIRARGAPGPDRRPRQHNAHGPERSHRTRPRRRPEQRPRPAAGSGAREYAAGGGAGAHEYDARGAGGGPREYVANANPNAGGPGGAADANGRGEAQGPSPADALRQAGAAIGELKEYAAYYVATKLDGVKVTVRNLGVYAVLGIVGLIALSAVVTTAVVMLLVGLALAISDLFGDPREKLWIGALIVSLLVLGGLVAGVVYGMRKLTNTSRAALVKKYESRQREQRINYGHDVRGREADPGREVA